MWMLVLGGGLVGCKAIQNTKDKINGLTNPLAMEGLYLGIEQPSSPDIDLAGTGYDPGATAQLFLADAAEANDLENSPVSGADAKFGSDTNGSLTLDEDDNGHYAAGTDAHPDFAYQPGESTFISVTTGGEDSKVSSTAPQKVDVAVPLSHSAGADLSLDATGQDVDQLLVVVADMATGTVVWSNRPEDVKGLYDFSHGDGTLVVDVPGTAFSAKSVYAVGVAGLRTATEDGFDNCNTVLSSYMAGTMVFQPLHTI